MTNATDHIARVAIGTIPATLLIPTSWVLAAVVALMGIILAVIAAF